MAAVQQLKQESSGKGLLVGGVKRPMALAELGLIDEYESVVQPRLAGHGATLFAGLSKSGRAWNFRFLRWFFANAGAGTRNRRRGL